LFLFIFTVLSKRFLFLLFLTLSGVVFGQTTIYVNSATGNDTTGDGSSGSPYKTFHTAYTNASDNDIINLTGTFDWDSVGEDGDVSERGYVLNKDLTIQGYGDGLAIIQSSSDSSNSDRRIFEISATKSVTLKRLIIQNGKTSSVDGGGLEIKGNGTIDQCIIRNNQATSESGGGIDVIGSLYISNSLVASNTAHYMGGGINRNYYDPYNGNPGSSYKLDIINCTIAFNKVTQTVAYLEGGGVFYRRGQGSITNSTIVYNRIVNGPGSSTHGIGTGDASCQVYLKNNIIALNYVTQWGGDIGYRSTYDGGFVDNGNNIFGEMGQYASGIKDNLSNTTWLDETWSYGAGDKIYTLQDGSTTTGELYLSTTLNESLEIPLFSFLNNNSIAVNNGDDADNQYINIPRSGSINIGTYESSSLPTLTILSNDLFINSSDQPTITFTLTDSSTTFSLSDIIVSTGSISNFSSSSSKVYSVIYSPPATSSGTVLFLVDDNSFYDSSNIGNVSSTLELTFDTISPTLSSFTHDHDDLIVNGDETVLLTATFSENMTSTPTISIGGIVNDVINEEMTSTSSSVWTYSWNVPSAKNGDFSATVSGTDLFGNYYAGTDSITFDVDNYFDFTLTEDDSDNVFTIGEEVTFTLTTTETLSSTVTGSAEYPNPVYNFTNSYSPDTDTSWSRTFSHPTGLTGVVTVTVTASDLATNVVSKTYTYNIDTSAPTINNISSPMTNGTYTDYDGNNALSDTVTITVTFTEAVFVTGTPRLLLDTSPASYVYYFDGSGTTTLTFKSTVDEEVRSTDLNINDFELNGGTIVDSSSNTASLTLAYVISNLTNLFDNKNIALDAKNPTFSNYALSDDNNLAPIATFAVNDGDEATFSFESDKELLASSFTVTFTGFTPTLTTVLNTNLGGGQYEHQFSFTVSNTFPEGDILFEISATDQVTSTVVPVGNPTGIYDEEFFPDRMVIDRTAPTITSNANLSSDENTTTGPTVTASENVIYSITGGADQALVSINQATGIISFNTAPDYEAPIDNGADNIYEIIVKAIDPVGLTVTQTVNIQINDLNDTFGVEVTQTDIQTTESGETAIIDFVLITQPSANVTVGLSLSDSSEGSLSTSQLTFTPENWNTAQTVTINGVDDGLVDGDVTYQLITANTSSNDTTYNGLVVDDVTLTNIDDEIDSDGDGFFDYQDAFPGDPLEWLDTDGDGVGNNTDPDDDEDGISDIYENQLGTDPLDPNDTPSDFNANGIPDALEDSDGDGYNDDIDLYPLDPTRALDNDGDGIADNEDFDDDNDGIPDTEDAFPLDSRYSKDTDNDGDPNLTDPDDDGDGFDDENDAFPLDGTEHVDTDGDGIGNNADLDDDGDGVADLAEDEFISITQSYRILINNNLKKDVSSDTLYYPLQRPSKRSVGKWKIRKRVSGGNDKDQFTIRSGEPAAGLNKSEQKNNGSEGYLAFIIPPDINNPRDHNKDNVYEVEVSYINTTGGDTNVPVPQAQETIAVAPLTVDVMELLTEPTPREATSQYEVVADLDADKIQNSLDPDDDGDGIFTLFEPPKQDTDLDEYPDFQDPDDDNDGVFTRFENPDLNGDFNPQDGQDSNADGIKDYLDHDDDGDHILTINEFADPNNDGNPIDAQDFDSDGTPDYLDPDDDNDGMLSQNEINMGSPLLLKDTDRDGNPDYRDTDDDNDGVPTLYELDAVGNPLDTDGDGTIDPLDSDDDGDGLLTLTEDPNGNGSPTDDDTDNDGVPNYLESNILDRDDDGVVDEKDTVDNDPYNDQDGDGFPNLDETLAGTNPLDANSYPNGFFGALRASIDIVRFFSPNGDGINDTWQVKEIDRYSNNQIWIYTRSGTLLFNTQYYRNDWAGTHNGNPLPEGSYYYRIDLDGNGSVDFEGWLYLTR